MTLTEKILARASEKPQLVPGENAWVNVDTLMIHDICGHGSFDIFKKEFGTDARVFIFDGSCFYPVSFICFCNSTANMFSLAHLRYPHDLFV